MESDEGSPEQRGVQGPDPDGQAGVGRSFRRKFLTGLVVSFPLLLTFIAVKWLFLAFDGIFGHTFEDIFGRPVPGLGLMVAVIVMFGVGTLATTVVGRRFIDWTEKLMLSVPVVKSMYSTFKQLGDAFSPKNKAAFKKFVLVEYPRSGMHSFGFLTKECIIKNDIGVEERYMTVYIPTNHLYLGEIGLFKSEEVITTNLGVQDGIRIVLSAGIAAPDTITRSHKDPKEAISKDGDRQGGDV